MRGCVSQFGRMRVRWLVVALAVGASTQSCKELFGREPLVRQMVAGCESATRLGKYDLKGTNCDCVVRAATADFTTAELGLWASEPTLFDEGEMQTLVVRRATQCLKPMAIASCAKQPGSAQCVCLMTRLFNEFEGDAIVEVVERIQQGRPLPAQFNSINLECARGSR